jgi:hypothetical protein
VDVCSQYAQTEAAESESMTTSWLLSVWSIHILRHIHRIHNWFTAFLPLLGNRVFSFTLTNFLIFFISGFYIPLSVNLVITTWHYITQLNVR